MTFKEYLNMKELNEADANQANKPEENIAPPITSGSQKGYNYTNLLSEKNKVLALNFLSKWNKKIEAKAPIFGPKSKNFNPSTKKGFGNIAKLASAKDISKLTNKEKIILTTLYIANKSKETDERFKERLNSLMTQKGEKGATPAIGANAMSKIVKFVDVSKKKLSTPTQTTADAGEVKTPDKTPEQGREEQPDKTPEQDGGEPDKPVKGEKITSNKDVAERLREINDISKTSRDPETDNKFWKWVDAYVDRHYAKNSSPEEVTNLKQKARENIAKDIASKSEPLIEKIKKYASPESAVIDLDTFMRKMYTDIIPGKIGRIGRDIGKLARTIAKGPVGQAVKTGKEKAEQAVGKVIGKMDANTIGKYLGPDAKTDYENAKTEADKDFILRQAMAAKKVVQGGGTVGKYQSPSQKPQQQTQQQTGNWKDARQRQNQQTQQTGGGSNVQVTTAPSTQTSYSAPSGGTVEQKKKKKLQPPTAGQANPSQKRESVILQNRAIKNYLKN